MSVNSNDKWKKNFHWTVLFMISLSSIGMGVYRDGISVLFPFLQRDFGLTRGQIGLFSTFLYFTNAFFSLFSGHLVDLKGSKWAMMSGIFFVGILLLLYSVTPNFIILLLLATCTGIGLSINVPAANKGITEWFHAKWQGTATGIWSTSYPIGGIASASLLPTLAVLIGWRKAVLFPGGLLILFGLLILHFYQDKEGEKEKCKKYNAKNIPFWRSFLHLIKNINLLAISSYGFFLGVVEGAILTHFTLFLYLDYHLSEGAAGLGFALVNFGAILGRLGWGLISDRCLGGNRRKTFFIIGSLFLFITLILALFLKSFHPSTGALFVLAFLTGCIGRGFDGIFFPSITETAAEGQVGGAIGLALLFYRTGMLVSPPIFGYIADVRGSYDFSWLLIGILFFAASIGQYLFYLKSTLTIKHSDDLHF